MMKYYKFDLLENESQWSQNDAEYFKVFESIKELLPKDFLDIYLLIIILFLSLDEYFPENPFNRNER